MKPNKTASEQSVTWAEKFVGVWNLILFCVILLTISVVSLYDENSSERIAHNKTVVNGVDQQILLGQNQMLLAEISKMVPLLPQPLNNSPRTANDIVQRLSMLNPPAIDSVPCCGDPTDLPPVLKMVDDPVPNDSESTDDPPKTFEEVYEHEIEKVFAQMPEGTRSQIKSLMAEVDAFSANLGESDLAEVEKMKVDIREQFKVQEAMFMPTGFELELSEEELASREFAQEKMVHFRAMTTFMLQKKMSAIDKRIQESRQYLKEVDEIIYTPEELEQQDAQQEAIKAVTDLAFPE